jgi:hypothetical protein
MYLNFIATPRTSLESPLPTKSQVVSTFKPTKYFHIAIEVSSLSIMAEILGIVASGIAVAQLAASVAVLPMIS